MKFKEGIPSDEELSLLAQALAKEDPRKVEAFFMILNKNWYSNKFSLFIGELSKDEHVYIAQMIGLPLFKKLAPRLGLTSSDIQCLENEVMCLEYYADK